MAILDHKRVNEPSISVPARADPLGIGEVISTVYDASKDRILRAIECRAEHFFCSATPNGVNIRPVNGFASHSASENPESRDVFIRYQDLSEVGLRGSEGSVRAVVFYLLRGGIISFSLSTPSNPLTNESAHCNWATEVLTQFWTATRSMDKSQALPVAADAISNTRRQVKRESKRNVRSIFALFGIAMFIAVVLVFHR